MVNNSTDRFNGYVASLGIKAPCIVATSAPITLSGLQTVNDIAVVAGDRVLVKDQTNAVENGIYEASTSAWQRTPDFDGNRDVNLDTVVVAGVSGLAPIMYRVSGVAPFTIGSSQITWTLFFDSTVPSLQAVTDSGNVTTNDLQLAEDAVLFVDEAAAPKADIAGYGQFWVRNDVPNVPMFTNDAGEDQLIDPSIAPVDIEDADYTFVITDGGRVKRKTSATAAQTQTIPSNASVPFPIGTLLAGENDGSVTMSVAVTSDTLKSRADGTTGTRTIGVGGGWVAIKVAATTWKISGDQMT